jgi:hypothetical protein
MKTALEARGAGSNLLGKRVRKIAGEFGLSPRQIVPMGTKKPEILTRGSAMPES